MVASSKEVSLLASLLYIAPEAPAPNVRRPYKGARKYNPKSIPLYEGIMKGKGRFTSKMLMDLTGKTKCAVNCAMNTIFLPRKLVKQYPTYRGRRLVYEYEWIAK